MGWEPYQTVDPLEKEPQVCRGLFGVRSINSSLQNSIFQIHQIFNISYFPQFFFEKKKSHSQNVQKSSENLHKSAKHW